MVTIQFLPIQFIVIFCLESFDSIIFSKLGLEAQVELSHEKNKMRIASKIENIVPLNVHWVIYLFITERFSQFLATSTTSNRSKNHLMILKESRLMQSVEEDSSLHRMTSSFPAIMRRIFFFFFSRVIPANDPLQNMNEDNQ